MKSSEIIINENAIVTIVGPSKIVLDPSGVTFNYPEVDHLIRHDWATDRPIIDDDYLVRIDTKNGSVFHKVVTVVCADTAWGSYITHWWELPNRAEDDTIRQFKING